ncbi:unnamed protein product [Coccothraustes coccothraustes]
MRPQPQALMPAQQRHRQYGQSRADARPRRDARGRGGGSAALCRGRPGGMARPGKGRGRLGTGSRRARPSYSHAPGSIPPARPALRSLPHKQRKRCPYFPLEQSQVLNEEPASARQSQPLDRAEQDTRKEKCSPCGAELLPGRSG